MNALLLAMLVLASCAQEDRGDEPPSRPPANEPVPTISLTIDHSPREVTLTFPEEPVMDDEDNDRRPVRHVMNFDLNKMVLVRENFDRWVFRDRNPERQRWNHLDDLLSMKIQAVAQNHKLTAAQRAKLRTAGRGDIKRFFDQVQERRIDFEISRMNFTTGTAALRRLKPLSAAYAQGPFGDGSLFSKTLNRIVTDQKAGP
jgi:hypothetical protein